MTSPLSRYHSDKYPWIEAVYTYMVVISKSTDFDGVQVSIPAKKGPGHYIVNWGFQGYYDCVDVEVFDDRQVEHVDGKMLGGHTWSKIDHCQYVGVSKSRGITTPCIPATGNSIQECIDAVTTRFGDLDRLGINVVPIKNPATVAFPDQVNIPWKSDKCANTAWTLVAKDSGGDGGGGGTHSRITENPLPELKERLGNPIVGRKCDDSDAQKRRGLFYNLATQGRAAKMSNGELRDKRVVFFPSKVKNSTYDNVKPSRLTLRRAMQACGIDPFCDHIEARNLVRRHEDVFDDIATGEHEFYGCQSIRCSDSKCTDWQDRKVWSRPKLYDPAVSYTESWFSKNKANLTSWQISFHPNGSETGVGGQPLPEGWLADTGNQFSTHENGLKYGWTCDVAQPPVRKNNNVGFVGMNRGSFTSQPTRLIVNVPFDDEHTILNAAWVESVGKLTCPHESDKTAKVKNVWEIEVPNGMYRVGVLMDRPRFVHKANGPDGPTARYAEHYDINAAGCGIHHTAADQRFHKNHGQRGYTKWKNVEVSNNRLQLSGTNLAGTESGVVACSVMNTVQIYKMSDELFPPQWLPSSGAGGAWYQHEVPQGTKVGLVDIKFPRAPTSDPGAYGQAFADCRYTWMLAGDRCQYTGSRTEADHEANAPIGDFNGADQGFTVSVADSPCTADGGCVGGTVCLVVRAPRIRVYGRTVPLPQDFAIDCDGAQGKYVRIHLPGTNRIFAGAAYVNTVEPPAYTPNQLACYGVIPRAQTSTVPEYVISHDPADPIFYSSCYVRERNMEWVPPNTPPPPPPPPTSEFGTGCLDCSSYEENRALANHVNFTRMAPPVWVFSEQCRACSSDTAALTFEEEETQCPTTTTAAASAAATATPIGSGPGAPAKVDATGGPQEGPGAPAATPPHAPEDGAWGEQKGSSGVGVEGADAGGRTKGVGVLFAVLACLAAAAAAGVVYRRRKLQVIRSTGPTGVDAMVITNAAYDVSDVASAEAAVPAAASPAPTLGLAPTLPDDRPEPDGVTDTPEAAAVPPTSAGRRIRGSVIFGENTTECDTVNLLQHLDTYEI